MAEHGINKAQEDNVAGTFLEIGKSLGQSVFEIADTDRPRRLPMHLQKVG